MLLEPDRDQLEMFADALLRYAGNDGFVSVRAFYENDGASAPFRVTPTSLKGGLKFLLDVVEDDARRAAQAPKAVVFCPPLAVFANNDHAREQDIIAGLALSVECDAHPQQARQILEALLGPATVVVHSGGIWTSGNSVAEDKLHLHWRLARLAHDDDIAKLKQARILAARLVDGDPSNAPINHPIRWPGSWHRKADPRLCAIETSSPDIAIDLDGALDLLTKAAPAASNASAEGDTTNTGNADDWSSLVADIVSGKSYHAPLVSLAARMIGSNAHDGTTVKMLRGIMAACTGPRDSRWHSRYDAIPRYVSSARGKYSQQTKAANDTGDLTILSSSEFTANLISPDQLIEGILQRGFIYSLTGHTGRGKSALALLFSAHIGLERLLGHLDVEKGRVLYLAGENPTDIRNRWIAMSQQADFEIEGPNAIDVHFVEKRFPIAKYLDHLKRKADQLGGFDFVVVDSSAAFFQGDDENNNAQAGKHAAEMRALTTLPGNPGVLTLCHPPKKAGEDNLQPRGGGAYVAEIDGNLTVSKDEMTVTLHWQTKLRGPDFTPIDFLLRQVTHERLVTRKGKLMPTVVASLLSDTAKEEMTKAARGDEDQVLEVLSHDPRASVTDVAKALNWLTPKGEPYKSKVHYIIKRLQHDKLLAKDRGRYAVTDKGKKALKGG